MRYVWIKLPRFPNKPRYFPQKIHNKTFYKTRLKTIRENTEDALAQSTHSGYNNKFQKFDQIAEILPTFRFQKVSQISEVQPNRNFTNFKTLNRISDFQPNFRRFTKFQNLEQILEFKQTSEFQAKFKGWFQILDNAKQCETRVRAGLQMCFRIELQKCSFPAFVFQWLFSVCCYM